MNIGLLQLLGTLGYPKLQVPVGLFQLGVFLVEAVRHPVELTGQSSDLVIGVLFDPERQIAVADLNRTVPETHDPLSDCPGHNIADAQNKER